MWLNFQPLMQKLWKNFTFVHVLDARLLQPLLPKMLLPFPSPPPSPSTLPSPSLSLLPPHIPLPLSPSSDSEPQWCFWLQASTLLWKIYSYHVIKESLQPHPLIFFQKSWDFYTTSSVYLCSDCMLNLIATSTQLQRYMNFSFSSHF